MHNNTFIGILLTTLIPLVAMENEFPLVPIYKKTSSQTNNVPSSLEQLIKGFDANINQQYQEKYPYSSFRNPLLTITEIVDIAHQIDAYISKECSQKFIKQISNKNYICKTALEALYNHAKSYVSAATITDLDNIYHKTSLPNPLEKLPLTIKRYIMNKAKKINPHSYEIPLDGHPADICCSDICATTNTAAVGCKNKKVYIWNLLNGTCTCTIPIKDIPKKLRLNRRGLIAILSNNIIDVWKINSKEGRHRNTIPINNITHFDFTDNKNNDQLHVIFSHKNKRIIATVVLEKNNHTEIGISTLPIDTHLVFHAQYEIQSGNYTTSVPVLFPTKTLAVTKNKCYLLGICLQAIENTQKLDTLDIIKQASIYKLLTPYEQKIVDQKIENQREQKNRFTPYHYMLLRTVSGY